MPDTTQVNVKLPVSMKKDWEEYVEDNEEATSISHLIRLSVQREINDESRGSVDVSADDLDVDVDVTPLEDRMAAVEDTLEELTERVDDRGKLR